MQKKLLLTLILLSSFLLFITISSVKAEGWNDVETASGSVGTGSHIDWPLTLLFALTCVIIMLAALKRGRKA